MSERGSFSRGQREPENSLSRQSHRGPGLRAVFIASITHYFVTRNTFNSY